MAMAEETRSQLVALVQRQPANLEPGQVPPDLLNETREMLRKAFAELGYSGKFYLSKNPGTSGSVFFYEEAQWLLTEGRRDNPAEVVRRLERFVTRNEVVLQRVAAVWGLHPDRSIHLLDTPRLRIVPLANLRPSDARDSLLAAGNPNQQHASRANPRAAIVYEFIHKPLYFRYGEPQAQFTWDDKHFLSDLSLVLLLLNDSPVVRVAEWYQTDADHVPVLGIGQGWAYSFSEPRVVQEIAPQSYDEALAMDLVGGFLRFPAPDRQRITVALRRLNLAGLRNTRSDIALELGIALEALLSEASDPHDSISYRLKTRAAVLLSGSIAEREETARQVSRLYGLRSAAAHGEDLDGHRRGNEYVKVAGKKYTARELADTLEDGRRLCGRIARKLLQSGAFPNYHRMMLGETLSGA